MVIFERLKQDFALEATSKSMAQTTLILCSSGLMDYSSKFTCAFGNLWFVNKISWLYLRFSSCTYYRRHFWQTNKEILQKHLSTTQAWLECCNTCKFMLGQTLQLHSVDAVGIYTIMQTCKLAHWRVLVDTYCNLLKNAFFWILHLKPQSTVMQIHFAGLWNQEDHNEKLC